MITATGADAEADAGAGAEAGAGADAEAGAGTDAEADAGADAEADAGADAEADAGTDAEAGAGTDTGTHPGRDTGMDRGTGMDTGMGVTATQITSGHTGGTHGPGPDDDGRRRGGEGPGQGEPRHRDGESRGRGAVPGPADGHDLRHHGDAEVRDDGLALVDLAVNVRADTPPAWLRERIAQSLTGLAAYPDGRVARAAVAARHGVTPERVLLTAGAAEAFVLLARALRVRRPVVVHPQFTEPEAALRDAGHTVDRVLLRAEDGFRLDPAAVPKDADLVVIGNPTNPTSVLHPAATVTRLARPGRTLVVDEAFMDAVPGEREALAGRTDVPGLVVLRSLTKTWGLAGLRIGYVLAAPETIAELERAQPLWPVSTPALVAAEACMTPRALAEAGRAADDIAADRARLVSGLGAFAAYGLRVLTPAEGPFLLVRLPEAAAVRHRLRDLGYAVRRGDTFPGLGGEWLRLAVRDRTTADGFLRALGEALTRR